MSRKRDIFRHGECINIIIGTDGHILSVDKNFEKVFGYNEDDIVGDTIHSLRSSLVPEAFYDKLWAELTKKGIENGPHIAEAEDGCLIFTRGSSHAIRDKAGHVLAYKSSRILCSFIEIDQVKEFIFDEYGADLNASKKKDKKC